MLIINADDLGLAPGVTRGILELARSGGATSASLLPNLPGSAAALAAARDAGLDAGVHLNLCLGAPLAPPEAVPSIVGSDGRFLTAAAVTRRLALGRVRTREVAREWSAQIEYVLAGGTRPSHLDSHCHLHAYPPLYRLTLELARRYGIPGVRRAYAGFVYQTPHLFAIRARLRPSRGGDNGLAQPDHFAVLTAMGPWSTSRAFAALLRALPPGVTELVCYPGHVDDELRRVDPLTQPRNPARANCCCSRAPSSVTPSRAHPPHLLGRPDRIMKRSD